MPVPNQTHDLIQDHGGAQLSSTTQAPILQTSIFKVLPSELVLEIFSQLDIITIFRFLDTCRYHRYLLLNMPGIWRVVRFVPLSEYTAVSSSSSSTPLSVAAAAGRTATSSDSTPDLSSNSQFTRAYRRRPQRTLRPRDSSSGSESDSDESNESTSNETEGSTSRLKHAENERDRDRGGSRSLISEIYAVLRRFRKENGLVDHVREASSSIYMDSTDSLHFPSPLVMLIKFPHLQVLSSRYRRQQTNLITDMLTLKDMLRNGDILPHSLELRRWDLFNPYMIKGDVAGFKQILDAIAIVGSEMLDHEKHGDRSGETTRQSIPNSKMTNNLGKSLAGGPSGVQLDIRLCSYPLPISSGTTPSIAGVDVVAAQTPVTIHSGGGIHWAPPSPVQTPSISLPVSPPTALPGPPQLCSNIVWVLEKCLVCNAPQERCWVCVARCNSCNSLRVPPSINHQATLERQRSRQSTSVVSASGETPAPMQTPAVFDGRPSTPPGSISLSQMRNSYQGIRSAYISSHSASSPLPNAASAIHAPRPASAALARPPEFSLFD
ncbi:hypothetical protein BGZ79_004453 [Entomortierella chlamydospora]|nr:hypothetical protein BGZ79_004453 [Entomortierella chlamydospora]